LEGFQCITIRKSANLGEVIIMNKNHIAFRCPSNDIVEYKVKRVLMLRNSGYRHKLYVRPRVTVVPVRIWQRFSHCSKVLRRYPKGTGDTVTSDKYALILREVLSTRPLVYHRAQNSLGRKLPANPTFKTMGYFDPEGYLCIPLVLQESNIGPRPRAIAASN